MRAAGETEDERADGDGRCRHTYGSPERPHHREQFPTTASGRSLPGGSADGPRPVLRDLRRVPVHVGPLVRGPGARNATAWSTWTIRLGSSRAPAPSPDSRRCPTWSRRPPARPACPDDDINRTDLLDEHAGRRAEDRDLRPDGCRSGTRRGRSRGGRPNRGAARPTGRSPRSAARAVRARRPSAHAARRCHPSARSDSMSAAVSSISRRLSGSASRAAISSRRAFFRRSAAADIRIASRMASDRLSPDDSSVDRARCVSSSRRTETAIPLGEAYHVSSYTNTSGPSRGIAEMPETMRPQPAAQGSLANLSSRGRPSP